jgi:excisionase family DNA binding protein
MANKDELLTTKQAAELYSYSNDHLSLLLRKGVLKGKKIGRDWFTTRAEIEKYLRTNPKPGPSKRG